MSKSALQFGTKAETLVELSDVLEGAVIAPLVYFSFSSWTNEKPRLLKDLLKKFNDKIIIVRSSAQGEDAHTESMAGAFESVANIRATSTQSLEAAIDQVFASYGSPSEKDQVLVQEQIIDVDMSGVLFTRDLVTGAPYITVNYDDVSQSTSTVTSGQSSTLKTFICFRSSPIPIQEQRLAKLIDTALLIERLFKCDRLDIEFAIDRANTLYILQVRPLASLSGIDFVSEEQFGQYLSKIFKKTKKLSSPHPGLYGQRGMYSVMTDWNPAEMIGTKPKMLAMSLYKQLITDSTWAYQRDNYGYKNLRSFPLLISFVGHPYIDVRVSFNSFVPKAIDDELSHKLVDYYTFRLLEHPTDHDKVEFNIIFSCYYLNLNQQLKPLLQYGFNELELDRIKFALLELTNSIICPDQGLCRKDLEKVERLAGRFDEIVNSSLPLLDKIYWLVQDCQRYGTLPFAGLARAGFIAVQFLRSFVDCGIATPEQIQLYMNSLNTVAKQLSDDSIKLRNGDLDKVGFLEKYGHLRPGTYDILSKRYDHAFEDYFKTFSDSTSHTQAENFEFSKEQKDLIQRNLIQNGIQASADSLLQFIKEAIEGREYGKFLFTKSLSQILLLLEELGVKYEIDNQDLAFLNIQTILNLYSSVGPEDLRDILWSDIERNKGSFQVAQLIKLPQLICSENDVYQFTLGEVEPNFVTLQRVTEFVVLEEDLYNNELSNKIVFVKSADPGYDWLFTRKIAGLITMYGGANSHMAIRCAELGIPAVIGCGEQNYETWSKSKILEIDCSNRQVRCLS